MTKTGSFWNKECQGLTLSTAGLVLTALQDVYPDMGQPLPQNACHQLVTIPSTSLPKQAQSHLRREYQVMLLVLTNGRSVFRSHDQFYLGQLRPHLGRGH